MKVLKKILIILVLIVLIFNIYKLFIKEHKVSYKIDKYNIEEHFYIKNNHYYDMKISNKKETYIYTLNENLSKRKKIIKNIKTYKSNNLVCIVPTYKKNIEKEIYCNLDNQQVSNSYLNNHDDFKKILKKAKIKLKEENNIKTTYKKVKAYKKNIATNIYFIWDYKGIYIIDKDNIKYRKILKYDLYENVLTTTVDKYFVLFDNHSVNGIEDVYYYDVSKDKLKSFKLKNKLSKASYINGVIKDLIFITDTKKKKEYTVDIRRRKIKEIDEEQTKYIVYNNGQKQELSKSDYFMKEQIFSNNKIINEKISREEQIKEDNYYYFIEENKMYRTREDSKNKKVLLFELDNISDWIVKDKEIFLIREDTIYSYTDKLGLRKVVESNELKYNYKNIYEIMKK